jgi:alcohol dehydrogenase class IV
MDSKSRYRGGTSLIKKARAAHTNIIALNALRESIELNDKLKREKIKKKKLKRLNDRTWKQKLSSSDSECDSSKYQEDEDQN